jgi:chromosome segregation ATPase
VEKDHQKIKALMGEKNKMREMIDNLKMQLAEKERENTALIEKIAALRKVNQTFQAQLNIKAELDEEVRINKENTSKGDNSRAKLAKLEEKTPKKRVWKKDQILE